ncbi:MAG: hypothetical protein ACRENU_07225 [Gemmatimonadaceae bacterium]
MISNRLMKRASMALLAFAVASCGDSTGPKINLTEEQVMDMLEAMTAVNSVGALGANAAVITVSETVSCPNGGSTSVSGSVNDNNGSNTVTMQATQGFSNCAAPSESTGRVWTFNGSIATNFSITVNEQTEEFSMTGTQIGGISASSDLGSGGCDINITITLTSSPAGFSGSLNGTACGHTIQQTITAEP